MPLKLPIGIFFLGEVGGSEAEPWTREVRLDPRTPSTMMKGQLDSREGGRKGNEKENSFVPRGVHCPQDCCARRWDEECQPTSRSSSSSAWNGNH